MRSHSPSDRMFDRMDTSLYACVPRDLVEELIEARRNGEPTSELERDIADAAMDDIT